MTAPMKPTPIMDAIASDMEHLGPGGRMLHYPKLWREARRLERERAELIECATELLAAADASYGSALTDMAVTIRYGQLRNLISRLRAKTRG